MNVTIAHFYYDLLNLYGENGNVKALKMHLESLGLKVKVKFLTIGDALHFDEYDLIYLGMGTEENQKKALAHLLPYKKEIKKYIEENKFILATGNSIELFGKKITDKNNKVYEGIHVFDYEAKEENFRLVDEAFFESNFIKEKVIGFQNQGSVLKNNPYPMFKVIRGIGSYPKCSTEGVCYKHFYGTYLIGPLLIRNPYFLKYFLKEFLKEKNYSVKLSKLNLKLDTKAYETYLKNYFFHEK